MTPRTRLRLAAARLLARLSTLALDVAALCAAGAGRMAAPDGAEGADGTEGWGSMRERRANVGRYSTPEDQRKDWN